MIKEFHFERRKKQEAEGYDSKRNSNSNLREAGVIAFSNIGKVRQANEDDWGVAKTPNGYLFVLCDGMGGHVGGQEASRIAVESIIEHLKKKKYPEPLQALDEALQFANMQILGYANQHLEFKGMGTTACILLIQGDKAYIAHVGDSRIYLYLGKEKQLHRITEDHSWVQLQVRKGLMTEEQAERDPNKNRILKVLGIKPELQPTFNYRNKPILPKNGDVFLICSDGLNGMISDSTIKNVLSSKTTIEQKGEELIKRALKGENGNEGGQDNITVELIQIASSKHKKSEFTSFNPKSKPQSSASKSRKLIKIMKWVAAAIILLAVSFVGGLYFYGNSKKNEEIKLLIDEKNKITTVLKQKNDSLITEKNWQDELKRNMKIAESGGIPNTDDIQKKYRENDNKIKELVNDSIQYKQKLNKLDSIILSIEKRPLRKFINFKNLLENESNNNRKNSGQ